MTTGALATIPSTRLAPSTGRLVPTEVMRDQLNVVQQMREVVRTAPLAESMDIAEKARWAAKFARVAQAAGELAAEAVKLECQALRRVGQLDPTVLKGERKKVAEAFAAMSDQEFAVGVLVRAVANVASATAVYRSMRAEERHASDVEQFWSAPASTRATYSEVRAAAETLLARVDVEGADAEIVDGLARELGLDDVSDALAGGLRAIAEHAIANVESGRWQLQEFTLPEFVTIRADVYPEFRWRRVPVSLATVPQLRSMIDDRRRQAEELLAAVGELEAAAATIAELGERFNLSEPEPGQVGRILQRAIQVRALHREVPE